MKPYQVIEAVEKSCVGFKRSETIAFQRYFMSIIFPSYSQEAIAHMTDNCDKSMVCKTIKKISQAEYSQVRDKIFSSMMWNLTKPKYKWLPKN